MIGIDPGGSFTGVVARPSRERNARPTYAAIVVRGDEATIRLYLLEVLDTIERARAADTGPQAGEIAVENVRPPTGWKASERVPIDPEGLLNTAVVLGAVLGRWPNCHLVEPAGHGSSPLALYPESLIGPRERLGTGRRRHARSAWDVAGVALCHPDPTKADPGRVTPPPPNRRTTP